MCLSAITWSGFDNFYYFFSYEDSRDAFSIPHDLRIMDEVFGCSDGGYAARNAYWSSQAIQDLDHAIEQLRLETQCRRVMLEQSRAQPLEFGLRNILAESDTHKARGAERYMRPHILEGEAATSFFRHDGCQCSGQVRRRIRQRPVEIE